MQENTNIESKQELLNSLKYHKELKTSDGKNVKRILLFRAPAIDYSDFDIPVQRKARWMVYQPIGLAYLAASLRENLPEIEIMIYDLEYETVKIMFDTGNKSDILESTAKDVLGSFRPDLVGISVVYSPAINNAINIAKVTKEHDEDIKVVFGGVHSTFDYENILKSGYADTVFLKEAEETFVDYLKYLNGDSQEDGVRGVAFLDSNQNIEMIPYKEYPDFDKLPLPAWDLVDTANYYRVAQVCGLKNVIEPSTPTGVIQTSRGCSAHCAFCSVKKFSGLKVRDRSVENVLNEIDVLYNKYGIKGIEFVDDDFTHERNRALKICKGIIKRKYDITWSLDNGVRILTLDEELIENFIASGCRLISVGVESGNKEILKKIRKPLSIKGLYEKMSLLHRYPELYVKGNFIVGFPFETNEQMRDTFRVASELEFDWTIFSTYSPLVGTDTYLAAMQESNTDIDVSRISYEKTLIIPDGYTSKEEFSDKVYLENLRCNFIENSNYRGRNLQRALKDFKRVVTTLCPDHAVSIYCISKIYKKLNDTKNQINYFRKFNDIVHASDKWRFYCESLNIPIDSACKGEYV